MPTFSLLQPAIDFCFNGIIVNQHAAFFGKKVKWYTYNHISFFTDHYIVFLLPQ